MSSGDETRIWEKGWDGHHEEQLRRLARLSLAEKLEWLEEADRVVRHLRGAVASANPMLKQGRSVKETRSR